MAKTQGRSTKPALTLDQRRAFLKLPLPERRRRMAAQAKRTWSSTIKQRLGWPTVRLGKGATSSMPRVAPRRGEIWLVNFDPTIGTEIRKTRPAVVISSDAVGSLPIELRRSDRRLEGTFCPKHWHFRSVAPTSGNSLHKISAVDVLQLRGINTQRFVRRLGIVGEQEMESVVLATTAVIEGSSPQEPEIAILARARICRFAFVTCVIPGLALPT